jgi:hypothetical protein
MRYVLILLPLCVAAYCAVFVIGAIRWTRMTGDLLARMQDADRLLATAAYDPAELEGLPTPVQRYFRWALTPGQPIIAHVEVRHKGMFNMDLAADRWAPFTSRQHVVTARPGFVWDGRMRAAPGLPIRVIDAYVAGEGALIPALFGLFDITRMQGSGEIARGELMRYFAEAAWYPTALLPSQSVTWRGIDDATADATLTDGDVSLTMRFTFAPDGAIESVRADARGYTNGDRTEMHPWEGRWSNYQQQGGMRVPLTGEVAWLMPQGRKPYWRGSITAINYDYASAAR